MIAEIRPEPARHGPAAVQKSTRWRFRRELPVVSRSSGAITGGGVPGPVGSVATVLRRLGRVRLRSITVGMELAVWPLTMVPPRALPLVAPPRETWETLLSPALSRAPGARCIVLPAELHVAAEAPVALLAGAAWAAGAPAGGSALAVTGVTGAASSRDGVAEADGPSPGDMQPASAAAEAITMRSRIS